MKIDLSSYADFRDSGIPWIGVIPSHWETRQLGFISNNVLVGVVINPSSYVSDEGVPFLLGGDIQEFKIDTTNCNYCPREVSAGPLRKSRLSAGDLVVVRVGYPGVAAVVPPELEGANCASMMLIRKHPRFCSQWLAYVFNSQIGRDQVGIVQYGAAQKQFNIGHAVKFRFPFPPIHEQYAIAAFLDRETAKIDRLADVRRKQIECLREQRTAVIYHAVTKGLDPAAKMKPSGVEWLGDIPEAWELIRLGYIASVNARLGWKGLTASEYVDSGNIFLSTPDIKGSEIDFSNANFITDERYYESPEIMLEVGDVLLVKDGATLGIVNLVRHLPSRATVNGSIAVIRVKRKIIPAFLHYFIKSQYFQSLIQKLKGGMGVPHLFQSDIVKLKLLIPPQDEQAKIVAHLDRETAKLDTLIAKYRRELDLLAEYRASLISHAVTGKIDVRGMVEIPG